MTHYHPQRNPVDRRAGTAQVVTMDWLQRWALRAILAIFVGACLIAWNVSAQVQGVQDNLRDAQAAIPDVQRQVVLLTEEVRLLRKGQDSLVTLMTDRERRCCVAPTSPIHPTP